jgi:hypothetical protein
VNSCALGRSTFRCVVILETVPLEVGQEGDIVGLRRSGVAEAKQHAYRSGEPGSCSQSRRRQIARSTPAPTACGLGETKLNLTCAPRKLAWAPMARNVI